MEYKVSLIVPIYNAEKYLEKCIDSLLTQTLDDIEIILLDDGSSDGSEIICDRYAQQYDCIAVFHLNNGGPSRARNIGLENAHGQYVGFVDADDYVSADMFSELYSAAKNSEADIVMCSYYMDNGHNVTQYPMQYKSLYEGREEIKQGLAALYSKRYHNGLYSVCNKLFNNSLLQTKSIRFDEELIRAEDAWFVFDCLKYAIRVQYIDKPLYYYRQVASSTMHTIQSDRFVRSKGFREKLEEETNRLGIEIDYNELYYEFLYEAFTYCRGMLHQGKNQEAKKVINDAMFFKACKYSNYLPKHLKIMCRLERWNMKRMLILLLAFWGKVN